MNKLYLPIIIIIFSFSFINDIDSQKPAVSFFLNTNETGTRKYIARDSIVLSDGFSYKASGNNYFLAKVDPFLLFPPSDKTYKRPQGEFTENKNEGSVVGSIPGNFSVEASGAANYRIPIECPPGINGMEPSLSLVYNSQSGVGIGSLNFSLTGISCIERVSHSYCYDSDNHAVSFDGNDKFAMNGKRLMLISGSYGKDGAIYSFEVEDYSRITSKGTSGDGPTWFEVETKDGKILEFGRTSDSRMTLSDNAGIYKWYLNKVKDRNDNYIRYFYNSKEDGEIWISKIEYTGNENTGKSPACNIEFEYYSLENMGLTSGILPKFIARNELKKEKYLKEIVTKSSKEYRRYKLNYAINSLKTPLLYKIEVQNRNGEKLPETVFEWGNIFPETSPIPDINGKALVCGDFTGDGKDNIAKVDYDTNTEKYWLSIFSLGKDSWYEVENTEIIPPNGYNILDPVFLYNCGDFNNDGADDLVVNLKISSTPTWATYTVDGKTLEMNVINIKQKIMRPPILGDFDGDGYNGSILTTETNIFLLKNQRKNELSLSDNLLLSTIKSVYPGDFNGDGKTDILFRREDDLRIYSLDDTYLKLKSIIDLSAEKCFVGDLNNDGIADIVSKTETLTVFYISDFDIISTINRLPDFSLPVPSSYSKGGFYRLSEPASISNVDVVNFSPNQRSGILLTGVVYADYLASLNVMNYERWISQKYPFAPPPDDTEFLWNEYSDYVDNKREEWDAEIEELKSDLQKQGLLYDIIKNDLRPDIRQYSYTLRVYHQGFNYLQISPANVNNWIVQREERRNFSFEDIENIFLADFRGTGRKYLTLKYKNSGMQETMTRIHFHDISNSMAVKTIRKGMDNTYQIHYGPLISEIIYGLSNNPLYSKENNASYPVSDFAGDIQVVSSVDLPNGDRQSYFYRGAKVHKGGKGFLGFKKVISKSSKLGIELESQYSLVENLNILVPYKKVKSLAGYPKTPIETTTFLFSVLSAEDGHNRYILRPDEQKVKDHLNNTTKTIDYETYDDDGNLTKKTIDYGGGISVTEQTTLFLKKRSLFKNKPSDLIVTKRNSSGVHKRKTTFEYDSNGNITQKTVDPGDENELITRFRDYNGFGYPETIETEANGESRIIEIEYTPSGRFISKKSDISKGTFVKYGYNENTGLPEYKIDERDRKTTYEYDGFGRLVNTTFPNGVHKVNVLQWAGSNGPDNAYYYTYQEINGQTPVWTWYDRLGRKRRVDYFGLHSNKKISVLTKYDTKGQVNYESLPYFTEGDATDGSSFDYDDFGRLIAQTEPQNITTNIEYSPLKTKISFPEGVREESFNSARQLTNSRINGKSVEFVYWPSGQLKTATPEGGEPVQYIYNLQGNCKKVIDPDAGVIEKSFNGFGELIEEIQNIHNSGNSEVVTSYYYEKGGLINFIDVNGQITDYEYDDYNRLEKVTLDGLHTLSFEYDDYDRIIKQTETIEGNKTFISEKSYDKYGRLTKEIYPTGYSISRTYNKYGVPKNISDNNGKMIWEAIDENPGGQLTKVKKGEMEVSYTFDNRGFPEYIKSNTVIDRDYNFTQAGNLEYITDNLTGQKEKFSYDGQNRLTDWLTYKDDNLVNTSYIAYDLNTGTITNKTGIGYEMVYGENNQGPHALTSIKGKPSAISTDQREIHYTDFSKVEKIIEGEKELNITYGVNYQRVKMTYSDTEKSFTRYYQPNFEEEISGKNFRRIHYISAGDGLAAIYVQSGNMDDLYYAYTDHLGSLVAIADEDGNVVERFAYDPWGYRRNPDDWTQRITTPVSGITGRGYTMHEHLDAFGYINMNGRIYDPLTSRFLSPDPYIQTPGQWLNYDRYAYCLNNPMIYIDPSGYTWFGKLWNWVEEGVSNAWDWFWDKGDQFANWAAQTDWFPSSGGAGINSAGETWHYIGNSGNIYHNQLGNNYEEVVNVAIGDALNREAYVSGNSSLADVATSEGVNRTSSWFYGVGVGLNTFGTAATSSEIFLNSSISFFESMNSYSSAVGINYSREIGLLTKSVKTIKTIGGVTIIGGSIIDGIGVRSYYVNGPNHPMSVHPFKAGVNLGIGVYSFYVNPIVAPVYFGVDIFYPGGWPAAIQDQGTLIEKNQRILGPQWNMYKNSGGF
ncbi:MAG: hypothetical protein PWQ06_2109 [Anaerophaga sp.]|nr:hypothetical protein [Anaerophaga sp.]